jgi:uncharacterized membrane protein
MLFYFGMITSKFDSDEEINKEIKQSQNENFSILPEIQEISFTEKEIGNHLIWRQKKSFRIALISIFSALTVVLGYLLAYIPNIELFTLLIFLSGFVMGKHDGSITGLLSSAIFTFFNPLGASPLPLFIYQLIHYSLTGYSGGLTRKYLNQKNYFRPREDLYNLRVLILFGLIGGIITFVYDILSTLFGGIIVSFTIEYFMISYISGVFFTTAHLIGNILGFSLILPGLIQIILKILD